MVKYPMEECLKFLSGGGSGIEPIPKSTIFVNHFRTSVSPYSLQNVAKLNLMGRQMTMEGTRIGKGILKYFQSGGSGLGKP